MSTNFPRREFFRLAAGSALAAPVVASQAAEAPAAGSPPAASEKQPDGSVLTGLQAYAIGPQAWVRLDNRIIACYRAHPTQKFPYLYPLAGPATGLPVTDETSLPWPHHRSVYFGSDVVNGTDFWSANTAPGRIISQGLAARNDGPDKVVITDKCDWTKADGRVPMRDQRTITVSAASGKSVILDWDITWTAVEDIRIPKTNHSLFSIRAARELTPAGTGNLVSSEGKKGEKETFGQPAAWCAFYGARGPGQVVEGVCLMDHPSNPWVPCPWFTRDYGFASPTPLFFAKEPWKLAAGQSVRLRYRVVSFAGTPEQAGLAGLMPKG